MIIGYHFVNGGLKPVEPLEKAIWIDLCAPDDAEREEVSRLVGVALPSKADQEEIEQSARLYLDGDAAVMTANLTAKSLTEDPVTAPVTFILTKNRLTTIRHHSPQSFATFPQRAERAQLPCDSAVTTLIGLLDEIVGRLADITEHAGRDIDATSELIFRAKARSGRESQKALRAIGRKDGVLMHLRESLLSFERLVGFLGPVLEHRKAPPTVRSMVESQGKDIRAISEQTGFLLQKTSLLLDATLGMISIEQNAIIKIFSVVATAFLPPTLIASVYGMNFETMPELSSAYGYPLALGAMVFSAILPLAYFKWKGWF